jgi:acetyl/propionyl-CoA carboxylase alpha subunit
MKTPERYESETKMLGPRFDPGSSTAGLLVANRGEVAVRIMRAAGKVGMRTYAIYSEDDADSLHNRRADEALPLRGRGPSAYLDSNQIVELAKATGCGAIHPGYGFLAEEPRFAAQCEEHGIVFVGPQPDVLALFGDKAATRRHAKARGIPTPAGTEEAATLNEAMEFFDSLGDGRTVVVKAVAGGGGRGVRIVNDKAHLADAYDRCRSEAGSAFGRPDVIVEQFIHPARHVEVQVAGDGSGQALALGDRDCSLQRSRQKLIEIAPAFGVSPSLRDRLAGAAVNLAQSVRLSGLCTFEFLVDPHGDRFWFIEANPRLQVEHPITEETTGLDLVAVQLRLALGASLRELGLDRGEREPAAGFAVEARVNTETILSDGTVRPEAGTLSAFDLPFGPGVRVDTYCYVGYRTNPAFDSLLAKVICRSTSPELSETLRQLGEALSEFRIEGVDTNVVLLESLLSHPDVEFGRIHTTFVEEHLDELMHEGRRARHPPRFFRTGSADPAPAARSDRADPLAILRYGERRDSAVSDQPDSSPDPIGAPGTVALKSPVHGTVVSVSAEEGQLVAANTPCVVIEAMKMEHEITAQSSGVIHQLRVAVGDVVEAGSTVAVIEETG